MRFSLTIFKEGAGNRFLRLAHASYITKMLIARRRSADETESTLFCMFSFISWVSNPRLSGRMRPAATFLNYVYTIKLAQ
jgi:hypothetical protein